VKETKRPRALTRDDLIGLPAISYLRFSSRPQEKGSSVDRQQQTLDHVIAHFQLKHDRSLEDRARSASKGHHRKHGNLRVLLDSVSRGDFSEQKTVLVVEAMDRLFREGVLDVFPILAKIIRNNLVLVTGDLTIWDEVSIEGAGNHKLLAEINAAKDYTSRLSEFAEGGHRKRRAKLAKFAEDPTGVRPRLMARGADLGDVLRGLAANRREAIVLPVRISHEAVDRLLAPRANDAVAVGGSSAPFPTSAEANAPVVGERLTGRAREAFLQTTSSECAASPGQIGTIPVHQSNAITSRRVGAFCSCVALGFADEMSIVDL